MNEVEVKELFAPVIKKFKKRRILTKRPHELWAADLLDMRKYISDNRIVKRGRPPTKSIRGYRYILVVIDTFSKYLFLQPLEEKTGVTTTEAFEKILKSTKHRCNLLHVDAGTEFKNRTFEKLLDKYRIKKYQTYTKEKSAIAERVIRTINQKLAKHFACTRKNEWVSFLPTLLKQYNEHDVHRSIGMPPICVKTSNEAQVRRKLFPVFEIRSPKFKIGDRVRIAVDNKIFENNYSPRWTKEIFIITQIHYTDPITYSIKDEYDEIVLGKFYTREMQKSLF